MSSAKTIAKHINDMYGGRFFTASQAAKMVRRSPRTIKRWMREELVQAPTYTTQIGGLVIHLYSKEDIRELKAYAKISRKKKVDVETT